MTGRRAGTRLAAVLLAFAGLLFAAPSAPAAAAGSLRVLAVLAPRPGTTAAVTQVDPAPLAPLAADAAGVTVNGASVPATLTPLLSAGIPVALVVDASAAGAPALPQRLSGAAGLLLRLPPDARVTVVTDQDTPRPLVTGVSPADAIHALAGVKSGGSRATTTALGLARDALAGGPALVVLAGGAAAPTGAAQATLDGDLRAAGAVLAVVGDPASAPSWSATVDRTGGTALGAGPADTPGAFDLLAQDLQARYLVSFATPASGGSARLSVTTGDGPLTADVQLPAPAAAAPGAGADGGASGQPSAEPAGAAPGTALRSSPADSGSHLGLWVLVALCAMLLALLVAAGLVVLARRRRGPSPVHRALPMPGSGAGPGGFEPLGTVLPVDGPLPGVRVFDVSNPGSPTELDPVELAPLAPHRGNEPENATPEDAPQKRGVSEGKRASTPGDGPPDSPGEGGPGEAPQPRPARRASGSEPGRYDGAA